MNRIKDWLFKIITVFVAFNRCIFYCFFSLFKIMFFRRTVEVRFFPRNICSFGYSRCVSHVNFFEFEFCGIQSVWIFCFSLLTKRSWQVLHSSGQLSLLARQSSVDKTILHLKSSSLVDCELFHAPEYACGSTVKRWKWTGWTDHELDHTTRMRRSPAYEHIIPDIIRYLNLDNLFLLLFDVQHID